MSFCVVSFYSNCFHLCNLKVKYVLEIIMMIWETHPSSLDQVDTVECRNVLVEVSLDDHHYGRRMESVLQFCLPAKWHKKKSLFKYAFMKVYNDELDEFESNPKIIQENYSLFACRL